MYKATCRPLEEIVAVKMVDFDKLTCDLVSDALDFAAGSHRCPAAVPA